MGITSYGRHFVLEAIKKAVDSADVIGTDGAYIKGCPVYISDLDSRCVLFIIDISVDMASAAGVVDNSTQLIGYKLLHGSLVLYLGLLQGQTKPAGAGLLIKIKLTDGDIHE